MEKQFFYVLLLSVIMGLCFLLIYMLEGKTLNIKSRTVGDGQHGTACFASRKEIHDAYTHVAYTPEKWRKNPPEKLPQGIILGCRMTGRKVTAIIDEGDVHALMIGAAGVGKTAKFLYPNLEYCCASGMSFITTDTKGDLLRSYAPIAKQYYGYDVAVLDLRNSTRSDGFNMLHMVNKYMDEYLKTKELVPKAKAEKYAKITAKTIIYSNGFDASSAGQNAFFYDAAEGLLTAVILVIAEFYSPVKQNNIEGEQRHIISVFKLIQDLLAPSPVKGKSQFQLLMEKLPSEHKAKWFSGAALNTSEQGF